jgi:phosphoribosyl-ATP pyrophosphohydrolase
MLRSAQAEPDAYRASVLLEQGATAVLMKRMREGTETLTAMISAGIQQRLAQWGVKTTPEAVDLVAHTMVQLGRGYILLLLSADRPPSIETLAAITTRATLAVGDELGIQADAP